jgi:hypothetical protein
MAEMMPAACQEVAENLSLAAAECSLLFQLEQLFLGLGCEFDSDAYEHEIS